MSFWSSAIESVQKKFWHWVLRRSSPPSKKVVLQHKTIYVLPSWQGLFFFLIIGIMWLLGTNYENNLILAAAFLLISVMIVSILHAYKNLSGLQLQVFASHSVFAGDYAEFTILVSSAGQTYENVHLSLDDSLPVALDLIDTNELQLKLVAPSKFRGWLTPRKLLVESFFPLGIMRAWSWVQLDMCALIYPTPLKSDTPPLAQYGTAHGDILTRENPEDFNGLTPYQPGMALARIAWKQYSRGAGLHLKDYVGYQSQDVWLDWHMLEGLDTETRLSQLCYWVLELNKTSAEYGLRLPNQVIEPGSGQVHTVRILSALALYRDGVLP